MLNETWQASSAAALSGPVAEALEAPKQVHRCVEVDALDVLRTQGLFAQMTWKGRGIFNEA